jgi:hypothetical protein
MKAIQLELPLFHSLQTGDVVRIRGWDQLGHGDWTGCLGVIDGFPQLNHHIDVWLVGYFLIPAVPLILPFTPDQLEKTGKKHKTAWQYKTQTWLNKASL